MTLKINLLPPYMTERERRFVRRSLVETGQLLTHDKDLARSWPRLLEDCMLVVWWPDRWCQDWRKMFEPLAFEVMPYSYYRHYLLEGIRIPFEEIKKKIHAMAVAWITSRAMLRRPGRAATRADEPTRQRR